MKMESKISDLEAFLNKKVENRLKAVVYRMSAIGDMGVYESRSYNGDQYTDQTGNLRSSTGFNLVQAGRVVTLSDFESVKPTATEAASAGKSLLSRVAPRNMELITLTFVAGMDYAAAVSARGKNVIESAELLTREKMKSLIKEASRWP